MTVNRTSCNLCEAMCGLLVTVEDGRVTEIRGDKSDPLSKGHICPKAVALRDLQEDPDRLQRPVRRTADGWVEMSWPDAIDLVGTRLAEVQREHGKDAVGVYQGNPNVHSLGALTHMPAFVGMLSTRNRFSATSLDQLPHMLAARLLYGHQYMIPVPDVDRTSYLLILGANPLASNGSIMTAPGIGRRLRSIRARGGRVVVIDPRRTETAAVADEHYFIRPGTDAAFLLALIHQVFADDNVTAAGYIDGLDAVRNAVQEWSPERAAAATGVDSEVIRQVAKDFAAAGSAACYGRIGVSTQRFGAVCQWAIQVLNALTGNLDRPGGTMIPRPAVDTLRGAGPGHLGRYRSRVRGLPEFGGELPSATIADEILTPGKGRIHALMTIAGNPVLSTPNGNRLDDALRTLDFMVAIDPYINETTRHADVILPPTPLFERAHYDLLFHQLAVRNTTRWNEPVLPKPAHARHDWEIFRDLGRVYARRAKRRTSLRIMMTLGALRLTPRRIVDLGLRIGPYRLSLRQLSKQPGGVDLGALEPALPKRLRTRARRIDLAPNLILDELPQVRSQLIDRRAGQDLLLVGRRHLHDNNSWMHNSARLVKGRARHQLLMNPGDLTPRGLKDGQRVRVSSSVGTVEVDLVATADIMPGVVSLPHGFGHTRPGVRLGVATTVPGVSVNDLTDPGLFDELAGTAALNGVPVAVTAVIQPEGGTR